MSNIALALLLSAALTPAAPPSRPAKAPQSAASDRVLRLQVLLDRAHFSPGEIDGRVGTSLKAAVAAYRQHRMEGKAVADSEVADALAAIDAAPILVPYTITEADTAGPFVEIPDDMMEKAKLKALGYTSVLEALGEKFHASPQLLQRLNPRKKFVAGAEIQVPNVERTPLAKAAKVLVSKKDQSVIALDAQEAVIARYPATLGSDKDPLPIGILKINGVAKDPTFSYNPDLFWDANPAHAKAKLAAGPNSPVGVVWIDLSKPSMGIHGTPSPAVVGKRQSHGCIRLTNWDASELASLVGPGTPAVLTE